MVKKYWLVFRGYEEFIVSGIYDSVEAAKSAQQVEFEGCNRIIEVVDCVPVQVWQFTDWGEEAERHWLEPELVAEMCCGL
jgi:hypothetical protein